MCRIYFTHFWSYLLAVVWRSSWNWARRLPDEWKSDQGVGWGFTGLKSALHYLYIRLTCQPATRPTGRANMIGHKVDTGWQGRLLIHLVKMPYYITLSAYKNRHKCLGSITMQKNKPGNNLFSAFSMRKQINLWIHWMLKPIWHVIEYPTMYYFGTPSLSLSQR